MPETKAPLYLLKTPNGGWRFQMLGTDCQARMPTSQRNPSVYPAGSHPPKCPACNGTGRVKVDTVEAYWATFASLDAEGQINFMLELARLVSGQPRGIYEEVGLGGFLKWWGTRTESERREYLEAALEAAVEAE